MLNSDFLLFLHWLTINLQATEELTELQQIEEQAAEEQRDRLKVGETIISSGRGTLNI